MKQQNKPFSLCFALAAAAAFAVSALSAQAQSATATISGIQSGSDYDYTITLQNTGTTPLDAFFYGWPSYGPGSLTIPPFNPGNSLGWGNNATNSGILYVGNSGNALAPGKSATFTFASPESPTDITTSPQGESVAYVGEQYSPPGISGVSTPAFFPTLVAVPESTSPALLAVGCLGVVFLMRKKAGKPVSDTGEANES